VTRAVPAAEIRRRIRIPLRFADDYSTIATVVSFTGLIDGQQHVALGHRADERDYTSAAQMLHTLGAHRIGLLSNNPDKGAQLARLGITIARQIPTTAHLTGANADYLATKARRGGHHLLLRELERVAEPHRHPGPLTGPAELGFEAG
jgi:hypothetical protein